MFLFKKIFFLCLVEFNENENINDFNGENSVIKALLENNLKSCSLAIECFEAIISILDSKKNIFFCRVFFLIHFNNNNKKVSLVELSEKKDKFLPLIGSENISSVILLLLFQNTTLNSYSYFYYYF